MIGYWSVVELVPCVDVAEGFKDAQRTLVVLDTYEGVREVYDALERTNPGDSVYRIQFFPVTL